MFTSNDKGAIFWPKLFTPSHPPPIIHFNIFLKSIPSSFKWPLTSTFSNQHFACIKCAHDFIHYRQCNSPKPSFSALLVSHTGPSCIGSPARMTCPPGLSLIAPPRIPATGTRASGSNAWPHSSMNTWVKWLVWEQTPFSFFSGSNL